MYSSRMEMKRKKRNILISSNRSNWTKWKRLLLPLLLPLHCIHRFVKRNWKIAFHIDKLQAKTDTAATHQRSNKNENEKADTDTQHTRKEHIIIIIEVMLTRCRLLLLLGIYRVCLCSGETSVGCSMRAYAKPCIQCIRSCVFRFLRSRSHSPSHFSSWFQLRKTQINWIYYLVSRSKRIFSECGATPDRQMVFAIFIHRSNSYSWAYVCAEGNKINSYSPLSITFSRSTPTAANRTRLCLIVRAASGDAEHRTAEREKWQKAIIHFQHFGKTHNQLFLLNIIRIRTSSVRLSSPKRTASEIASTSDVISTMTT